MTITDARYPNLRYFQIKIKIRLIKRTNMDIESKISNIVSAGSDILTAIAL